MPQHKNSSQPSEEMRWIQFYSKGYEEILSQDFPRETLWKFIERGILSDNDRHDAILYFGRHIKRSEFIEQVHLWGRVMKGMGVQAGDHVLLFGPSLPEFIYILMASNMIGAVAILPNLMAPQEVLCDSMYDSRVAFVFDGLEHLITDLLARPAFEHVVVMTATRSMNTALKLIAAPLNRLKTRHVRRRHAKYISADTAIRRFGNYDGELEAPTVEGQAAIVFSSSGTALNGKAKMIGMSNEAMISMFQDALAFNLNGNPFREGTVAYCPLPPFVCTGFFVLMLAPLFRGMTTYLDPRLSADHFVRCILTYKPQITLVPGHYWEVFFQHVERLVKAGKRPDLSFFRMPIMGGEGCTPETLRTINNLMRECGSPMGLTSGYGLSETFSVATLDYQVGVFDKDYSKPVVSVGYPFPGVRVGIFDEQGRELGYGQRGEIWVKTPAQTTGYLNNETATAQALHGEWFRTTDFGEMNEQGMLYVYGRIANHIVAPSGEKVYLFDIANELRKDPAVKDSLVCTLYTDDKSPRLVAHLIVSDDNKESDEEIIVRMDAGMKRWLPEGVKVEGYMLGQGSLKCNLVGKTDLDYYRHIVDGYRLPVDGVLKEITMRNNKY